MVKLGVSFYLSVNVNCNRDLIHRMYKEKHTVNVVNFAWGKILDCVAETNFRYLDLYGFIPVS